MRLERFRTESFAGLGRKEVEFDSGLNVLLGPNEAGKSTIIEAIYHTIFKDAKLNRTRSDDKEFCERFMPYPGGNYIHGCLSFEVDGREYRIEKEWGENPSVYLILPGGQKVTGDSKIEEVINELFEYGEGTYGNIVFTRQRDVKSAIEKIVSDDRVTSTVSSFLRRAVMELDGISVEKLRARIDGEIDDLLKRWDYPNMRPENTNRGVHNPFKQGCGRVYEAYIQKEHTRLDMERALEVEREYERVSGEMKELKDEEEELTLEIEKLSGLEGDILKRGQLEPGIGGLQEKIKELKDVNLKWPVLANKLEEKEKELGEKEDELKILTAEREQAKKLIEKKQLDDRLSRIDTRKKEISELEGEKERLPEVSEDDINTLNSLNDRLNKSKAAIEAATLLGRIKSADSPLVITRGMGEREELKTGAEFTAEGYLRIEVGGLDMEIQSGQIDFASLQGEYRDSREGLEEILQRLGTADIKESRKLYDRRREIAGAIQNKKEQLEEILDGEDHEELKARAAGLASGDNVRELPVVEGEIESLRERISELEVEIKTMINTVRGWEEKYGSHDMLFNEIVELTAEIKVKAEELAGLAELPEGFESAGEFNSYLASLRERARSLGESCDKKRDEMFAVKENLPEVSYEELAVTYEDVEREYERLVKRAGSMLRIKEVFEEKLEEMDRDSFRPLIESFSKYLSRLTAGHYDVGMIGDDFQIEVSYSGKGTVGSGSNGTVRGTTGNNVNGMNGAGSAKALPANINILSFGTYDGVALALRFALLEQLFKDRDGFIVLDDCLVNLDPERKKEAVDLINAFAEENQVIFTTCNPDTARALGGKIIELE